MSHVSKRIWNNEIRFHNWIFKRRKEQLIFLIRLNQYVKKNQPVSWYHKDQSKSNQFCLYCGTFLGEGSNVSSDKEHLIARSFVIGV